MTGPSAKAPDLTAYQLRPVRQADADAVLEVFSSAPDMARQGEVTDLHEARAQVEWLRGEGRVAFAVTHEDRLVGVVAIVVDGLNRNGWVFYWLHASHRGRGVMARATATVASWALTRGGLERLELGHRVDNPSSGGVAAAAGFVVEGRERAKFRIGGQRVDVLTYGRLASDPWPSVEPLPLAADPAWGHGRGT